MGWGGGWGTGAPETARVVAKAFYEGRPCKRGNCETDGESYWLEGHTIARRVDVPSRVAYMMIHDREQPKTGHKLSYSFAGWPTKMTARHLSALGLNAECRGTKDPSPRFNGIAQRAQRNTRHE